jgi:hypothetical protein
LRLEIWRRKAASSELNSMVKSMITTMAIITSTDTATIIEEALR